MMQRLLPYADDVERSVLGAVMVRNEWFREVAAELSAEDFYNPRHRLVFRALLGLFARGMVLDPLNVREQLGEDDRRAGGLEYYFLLADQAAPADQCLALVRSIREASARRRLIRELTDLTAQAHDETVTVGTVVEGLARLTLGLTERLAGTKRTDVYGGLRSLFDGLQRRMESPGSAQGLRTRFTDLDRVLGGLQRGGLLVVAGGSATGKTTFAVNVVADVALNAGTPALFFSLQVDRQALLQRMLCAESQVGIKQLRRGLVSKEEIHRLQVAGNRMALASIEIDDTPSASIGHIRRSTIGWAAELLRLASDDATQPDPPGIVIVDCMGLVRVAGGQSEQGALLEAVRGLKALARETGLLVLAICHVDSTVDDGVLGADPGTAQPRGVSGSVEAAADAVLVLQRDRIDQEGTIHVVVTKSSNGAPRSFELLWLGKCLRLENLSEQFDDETTGGSTSRQRPLWESV
ncbi:MAG: DnaB-like helicase C-terminal domain-containing protein [bacterium]